MSAILGTFCSTIRRLTRLRPADGTTARRAAAATVRGCLLIYLAGLLGAAHTIFAGDWAHWRGPNRNGISTETGWLEQWPEGGPPIAWRAKVGLGFSSMVVADNRVCTMGHENEQDTVFCFDAATGKELWKKSYPAELGDKYFEGGTTGTPTFDTNAVATGGGRIFTLSRWGDAFCFEAATGKIVWQKNIHGETGVRIPGWGFGGAPLVHENLVILSAGEAGVALEKTTGKIVWQSANKDAGYSTPLPFRRGDAWLALISSGQAYTAVDPKTGKEAWRIRWLTQFGVNAADPIVAGDYVFISSGYNKGGGLFKLGGAEPESFWKTKALRTQMNAAVLFDGHLYGVDGDTTEQGMLKCLEFNTGKELWKAPGVGSGTVMIANGKLIVLGARGELMIAPATPAGFKPVARAQVLGGKCWTVPVLAHGRVYARNARGDLVCVDLRGRGQ